jgi:small subunit ribosomal protein S13
MEAKIIHKGKPTENKNEDKLVRILAKDIEGKLKIYVGLTKIKGISWAFSNTICKKLNLDKNRKIGSLSKEEIDKINDFVKNPNVSSYLLNRRNDFETGKDKQLVGNDLEMQKDADVSRLKKIKSYRGQRHSLGLPMRGQRTRSHFRRNKKKSVGIKKKGKEGEKK